MVNEMACPNYPGIVPGPQECEHALDKHYTPPKDTLLSVHDEGLDPWDSWETERTGLPCFLLDHLTDSYLMTSEFSHGSLKFEYRDYDTETYLFSQTWPNQVGAWIETGGFGYTPEQDFIGVDSFTYRSITDTGRYGDVPVCPITIFINVGGSQPTPTPEFPSTLLPAAMIIGFLGAVLLIQRTREH